MSLVIASAVICSDQGSGTLVRRHVLSLAGLRQFFCVTNDCASCEVFFLRDTEYVGPARQFEFTFCSEGEAVENSFAIGASTFIGWTRKGLLFARLLPLVKTEPENADLVEKVETPESGNIAFFSYYTQDRILEIHFKDGGTYRYLDVSGKEFHDMKAAKSRGRYFHDSIRGAKSSIKL